MNDDPEVEKLLSGGGYEEILDSLAIMHPRVAAILKRAQHNRNLKIRALFGNSRLRGLEELIWFLETVRDEMERHPTLSRLAFLVERARADYEIGIEAMLAEMRDVVFNAMRDVMEIDYLLKDFTHEPAHIDEWLAMSPDKLLSKFMPGCLRKRQAKRLGIKPEELPTTKDYKGHSRFLHANPRSNPLGDKGVLSLPGSDAGPFQVDTSFWDMYRHGVDLILTIRVLFTTIGETDKESILSDDYLQEFIVANDEVRAAEQYFFSQLKMRALNDSG
ncbi:MAG: hypothetical protein M3464_00575 [Chloroflexota bacterium]|nr:hypothetical protein [Chloroflexota bacterium]